MNTKEVELFIPCCVDQLYPQIGFDTLKILEKLGIKAHYNNEQICCGQTHFKNGFWDEAKEIGEKFIHDLWHKRYVVSPSASCVSYFKNQAKELFHNTGLHLESKALRENIFELSDYLINMLRVDTLGSSFPHKVTFHDNCTALHEYGLQEEPRILLSNVKELELIEMQRQECCGFGGSFSLAFEPISIAMTQEKVNHALATEAEYIVSTDATCLGNMETYIKKHQLPIKCIHLASVLASGL